MSGIVAEALFERIGRTDTDAVRSILNRCREHNPSITEGEIARLLKSFFIPAKSTNPTGLIIAMLPKQCEAESIANYRAQWQHEAEAATARAREQVEQALQSARAILADPEGWDDATLEWARSTIVERGSA